MCRYSFALRRILAFLTMCLACSEAVHAEDSPSPLSDTSREVLSAVRSNDTEALQRLASQRRPELWLVADELRTLGEAQAAKALAGAAPATTGAPLLTYLAAPPDEADENLRDAVRLAEKALDAGETKRALRVLDGVTPARGIVSANWYLLRTHALTALGRKTEARSAFEALAGLTEDLGWWTLAAYGFDRAARLAFEARDLPAAGRNFERAIALSQRAGRREEEASAAGNLGVIRVQSGDFAAAVVLQERASKLAEDLGDRRLLLHALANLVEALRRAGELERAVAEGRRALRLAATWDFTQVANLQGNVGVALMDAGDLDAAGPLLESAWQAAKASGDVAGRARWAGNWSTVLRMQGRFARAIALADEALHAAEAQGSRREIARQLGRLAAAHGGAGDHDRAFALYERALDVAEPLDDPAALSALLISFSAEQGRAEAFEAALDTLERARAIEFQVERPGELARITGNMAGLLYRLGRLQKALELEVEALRLRKAENNPIEVAIGYVGLGGALRTVGRYEEARAHLLEGAERAERLGLALVLGTARHNLALLQLDRDENEEALLSARLALEAYLSTTGGHAPLQASFARRRFADIYEIGAYAAAAVGDLTEAFSFLERARAGALLEAMDLSEYMRRNLLPPALRDEDATHRRREAAALRALHAAHTSSLSAIRTARAKLEEVRAERLRWLGRVQREAALGAELLHPRVATLAEAQALLADDEALVSYLHLPARLLAMVVTKEDARTHSLRPCDDLLPDTDGPLRLDDLLDAEQIGKLRERLITPLGLAANVRRLLVSPSGRVSYLPFALLEPEREVVHVPSATVYANLHVRGRHRGSAKLAVGDPAYPETRQGRGLRRLPASRAEAEAVGDEVLLGPAATEAELRTLVSAQERWRAVHFACHGLVDPRRPARCALALTPTLEDDGLLTALEIFQMHLPCDLATLSACDTGRGVLVSGEGIVGLARAFVAAGADRVICSLWKVDDAATRALMEKYYALWSPGDGSEGLGAARALARAQAFVASQEGWEHPRYWAAWVLWGRAD